jgi:hypothetical protein
MKITGLTGGEDDRRTLLDLAAKVADVLWFASQCSPIQGFTYTSFHPK